MPTDRPIVFESVKVTRTKHFIDDRLGLFCNGKDNYRSLWCLELWASIYCESKTEEQDSQARESR